MTNVNPQAECCSVRGCSEPATNIVSAKVILCQKHFAKVLISTVKNIEEEE